MAVEYEIVATETWSFVNDRGQPATGYRVTFKVPAFDLTDHIVFSKTQYTPENVRATIEKQIEVHAGVLGEG